MKKTVIAYLHTHWDREWYREFEVFRIRLLRVFDNVLELLSENKIPSFYFDGQVGALLDYLEIRPEKEALVRDFIKGKRLFVGPSYYLIDEFLCDEKTFEKNLEIGLKISKDLGCEDFIGYFADTFGHSENIPSILKNYGIDKAIVWRGCGDLPSEFNFNGISCVNLIRGYFMDIFATDLSYQAKADFLKEHLDKINEKSSNVLLMPIGADHLGVPPDIDNQIRHVNSLLQDYQIRLGSIFNYFEKVKENFKLNIENELRDNSKTFILQGSYSSRMDLKKYRTKSSYLLDLADRGQKHFGMNYENLIEYGYKLLLQNMAHDGICGCSTDDVHHENIMKYKKVIQIAQTIIDEIHFKLADSFFINLGEEDFSGVIEFESEKELPFEKIGSRKGFENEILQNILKIPITEDYKEIYTYITEVENLKPKELQEKIQIEETSDLEISESFIKNSKIKLEIKNNKISVNGNKNFIELVDFIDLGDSYNFAPDVNDNGYVEKILSSEIILNGNLRKTLCINFENAKINVSLDRKSDTLDFKIIYDNKKENHLVQVRINTTENIQKTFSEDMNTLIKREFDFNYNIRESLPKESGIEAKTNTAPMQRYVWANGVGVVSKGLNEYEVYKNALSITLLRGTGSISNPKNPARSTPAGPPLEVTNLQLLGENICEFSLSFHEKENYKKYIQKIYNYVI